MTIIPGIRPIPEKRPLKKNELASALREAGRRFQQGMPLDNAALSPLLTEWSENRPAAGVRLRAYLDAVKEDAVREDRHSAMQHFRAAIEFVCDRDKPGRRDG